MSKCAPKLSMSQRTRKQMWKGGQGTSSAKSGYGVGNLGEVVGMEPRWGHGIGK